MDTIRETETLKYQRMWKVPAYRTHSPGQKYIEQAVRNLEMKTGDHILDVGCGSGKTASWLCDNGFFVHGIDIASNCLDEAMYDNIEEGTLRPNFYFSEECAWQLSQKVTETDWIVCTDVMEHIPEKMVHPVLYQLSTKMKKGGFFSISCALDTLGPKFINEQLHLTVRSDRWWADQLGRYWSISWAMDPNVGTNVLIFVHPRKEKQIEWPTRD